MSYLIVFQVLCGAFGAYVARRRGRNPLLWALVAAFVPVGGVALCLLLKERSPTPGAPSAGAKPKESPKRPKRCNGSYIPDCQGCPHYRRALFDTAHSAGYKGRCCFFEKDLVARPSYPVKVRDD